MRQVNVTANVNCGPNSAFELLADFASYPKHMSSVRSVSIKENANGDYLSTWEVDFRDGILKWVEHDQFDKDRLCIDFRQVEGDLAEFYGRWQVCGAEGDRSSIEFTSTFDLGIPSLESFLEPIAEDALCENITKVIQGLFGSESNIDCSAPR